MYMYVFVSANNSISSRSDYSRAASISFRACSGVATIRERHLFERGVYSVIYGMVFTEMVVAINFWYPLNNILYGYSQKLLDLTVGFLTSYQGTFDLYERKAVSRYSHDYLLVILVNQTSV